MPATLYPPVVQARKDVEQQLARYSVVIARHGVSAALHQVEYRVGPHVLAIIGWTDELQFVAHPDPQTVALIRSHHALEVAQ